MNEIVVCSHRGPFSFEYSAGELRRRTGSGGVVTALSALLRGGLEVSWIACALSDVDREVARNGAPDATEDGITARLLDIPVGVHRSFYDDACNTALGWLFHGLVDQAYSPSFDVSFRRGWDSYQQVSRAYAERIVAGPTPAAVLVEDYHLMLVADELRKMPCGAAVPTAYFHHIPWCSPTYFGMLPAQVRTDVLSKILSFDTIGFHSGRWRDEFLRCCAAFLPGADVGDHVVSWQGRQVPLVVAPAQVDVRHLREVRDGAAAARWRRKLAKVTGERPTLVRVDRVDLWKNIVRGFRAFERAVRDHGVPDAAFVAMLAKSRMHVPEHQEYLRRCVREVRRINRELGAGPGRGPIHLMLADDHSDHDRALAGLSIADAVLVNSTSDGLNLVAKESVIAADGRDTLVLSENTGVHEHIGRWTHSVNPFDIGGTAASIATALNSDRRVDPLLESVEHDSPARWLAQRLEPLGLAHLATPGQDRQIDRLAS